MFAAYLFSEISFLKLEKIKFAVKLFAFATVLVIAVSELSRVLASAVMSVENENIRSIVSVIGYTNQFVSLVFTVLIAAAVYIAAKDLADNGLVGKWVKVIPIVKIVQSVVFFVLKMVFQSWAATIGDYIVVFIFMSIYVVWLVAGNMKIKKRAEFESDAVTEV